MLPLAIWILSGVFSFYFAEGQVLAPNWSNMLVVTGLAMSMVVNVLVMSLIVFRIFKVFRKVKATSGEQILGSTGGSMLRPVE